jgi:hypothetical protein
MRKVVKFKVSFHGPTAVELPKGAQILSCLTKPDQGPVFYALVDPAAPVELHSFVAVPSEMEIPDDLDLRFLGTFEAIGVRPSGPKHLTAHLFEVNQKLPAVAATASLSQGSN